jgi:hypothetical protein
MTVRTILKIPRVKNRVKCIILKNDFALDTKTLMDQMREYSDPFEVLQVNSLYKDSMTMASKSSSTPF